MQSVHSLDTKPEPQQPQAQRAQARPTPPPVRNDYEPEPPPEDYGGQPKADFSQASHNLGARSQHQPQRQAEVKYTPVDVSAATPKKADEGEFMHVKSDAVSGLELLGKIATYLRKQGTPEAARVRELLSRGVAVKERDEVTAFVVPDDSFLLMSEKSVVAMLDGALKAAGATKPASVEKSDEDLYHDDLMKARELFGRDNVIPKR